MNASKVALTLAGAVAFATVAGSVTQLLAFGQHAGMPAPWSLPVALDLVGLVCAVVIHRRRSVGERDPFAWFILAVVTLLSTALQSLEGIEALDGVLKRTAHGIPPLGALVAFELALHLAGTTVRDLVTPAAAPAPAVVVERQATTPRAPVLPRETAPPRPVALTAGQLSAVTFDVRLKESRKVKADLERRGGRLNRDTLRAGLKAAGIRAGDNRELKQLLDTLREEATP